MLWPFKGVNKGRSNLLGPQAQLQAPSLAAWGLWRREKERGGKEEEEDRRRFGEGISAVTSPLTTPRCIPLNPSLREAPSHLAQVGGQRRDRHRHLGAHQEESREGRKERRLVGGSKGGRQAGGRRREGGEREGQRRDA